MNQCKPGGPLPNKNKCKSAGELAVHVFAVCPELPEARKHGDAYDSQKITYSLSDAKNRFIVTLFDGKSTKQVGPDLDLATRRQLCHWLFNRGENFTNRVLVGGTHLLWNMLDICRILLPRLRHHDFKNRILHQVGICPTPTFSAVHCYQDTEKNRNLAKDLVKQYYDHIDEITCLAEEPVRVDIVASSTLMKHYWNALPLWRMKWIELQGEIHTLDVKGYTIKLLPITTLDLKEVGPDCQRYHVSQSVWATHLVSDTCLIVTDTKDIIHDAWVRGVAGRTVVFVLEAKLEPSAIKTLTIFRGDERQAQLTEHLMAGKFQLCNSKLILGGSQFCASVFGMPSLGDNDEHKWTNHCSNVSARLRQRMRSFIKWQYRMYKQKPNVGRIIRANNDKNRKHAPLIRATIVNQLKDLNILQRRCAFTTMSIVRCIGYPGTGKTKLLAATLAVRFERVLELPAGWILCLTNSNVASMNIVLHAKKYPALKDYIVYKYSPMYSAYHEQEMEEALPFKLTRNAKLGTHGILVCTIGSFNPLMRRFKDFEHLFVDLIIDEAGLVWELDAMRFLPKLHNLLRVMLFGDPAQLAPYVVKLANDDTYFPSFMDVVHRVLESLGKKTVRLKVQYRMVPALCELHAPLFYDYKINTVRRNPDPQQKHGFYLDLVPAKETLLIRTDEFDHNTWQYERALSLYHSISKLGYTNADGSPYTFAIISPYKKVVTAVRVLAAVKLPRLTIKTVQAIQGFEANVVIIVAGASKVINLLKCRQRTNVATSRSKDITILVLKRDLSLGTELGPDGRRRLYPWGVLAMRANLWDKSDNAARKLQFDLNNSWGEKARDETTTTDSIDRQPTRKTCRAMAIAITAMGELNKYIGDTKEHGLNKSVLCQSLALRPFLKQCSNFHKNMYSRLLYAEPELFRECVKLYATEEDITKRNNLLFEWFGFKRLDLVPPDTERAVQKLFG